MDSGSTSSRSTTTTTAGAAAAAAAFSSGIIRMVAYAKVTRREQLRICCENNAPIGKRDARRNPSPLDEFEGLFADRRPPGMPATVQWPPDPPMRVPVVAPTADIRLLVQQQQAVAARAPAAAHNAAASPAALGHGAFAPTLYDSLAYGGSIDAVCVKRCVEALAVCRVARLELAGGCLCRCGLQAWAWFFVYPDAATGAARFVALAQCWPLSGGAAAAALLARQRQQQQPRVYPDDSDLSPAAWRLVCPECGARETTARPFVECGRCRSAVYCSTRCLQLQWLPFHSTECAAFAERVNAVAELRGLVAADAPDAAAAAAAAGAGAGAGAGETTTSSDQNHR